MLFGHPEKITGLGDDGEECSSPLVPKGPRSGKLEASTNTDRASSVASPGDGNSEERAIFWSFKQGVYFAYKWRCVSLRQPFMGNFFFGQFFQIELHEHCFFAFFSIFSN